MVDFSKVNGDGYIQTLLKDESVNNFDKVVFVVEQYLCNSKKILEIVGKDILIKAHQFYLDKKYN